jgi:plastocyanin
VRRLALAVIGPALLGAGLFAVLQGASGPQRHVIEMRGFAFVPAQVTVARGDTVVWINRDALPHTATSEQWDSGEMRAQATWGVVADDTGTLEYICAYHPSMRGTITVR